MELCPASGNFKASIGSRYENVSKMQLILKLPRPISRLHAVKK
jgi:hypothetical protein